MAQPHFRDRRHAGEQLAAALRPLEGENALVLGLPRGGVPVAFEVARAIGGELDIVLARKLGVPSHLEFGFGAIAVNAEHIDQGTVEMLGLTPETIAAVKAREHDELLRRINAYRGERAAPRIFGRTVVIVDDGVATGGTAIAALESIRREGPTRLIFAAPVGPPDAVELLSHHADDVVVLRTPEPFGAVGAWYERFGETTDAEVVRLLETARKTRRPSAQEAVSIDAGAGILSGTLVIPPAPLGLVIFAHGSGSSRFSPRNGYVARVLQERGIATLLIDLLTPDEEQMDLVTHELRFDMDLLATRLQSAHAWARRNMGTEGLAIGYFGSSTGGGAALIAAARDPGAVQAIVSRGGRPDLAGEALTQVRAPTLLLVGERDEQVVDLNAEAARRMSAYVELRLVPGATHLFEEPGALEEVAGAAADWFAARLAPDDAPAARGQARTSFW